jgi:hypothetical protein
MVAEITQTGLIVTTGAPTSAVFDELIALCNWPVLREANPRLLFLELEIGNPKCLLFWLDRRLDIAPTAKLITWLRERGPRPYRVVLAHCLEHDVEPVFRAAGAHGYLSIAGDIGATVGEALWPLLHFQRLPIHSHGPPGIDAESTDREKTVVSGFPAVMRPP